MKNVLRTKTVALVSSAAHLAMNTSVLSVVLCSIAIIAALISAPYVVHWTTGVRAGVVIIILCAVNALSFHAGHATLVIARNASKTTDILVTPAMDLHVVNAAIGLVTAISVRVYHAGTVSLVQSMRNARTVWICYCTPKTESCLGNGRNSLINRLIIRPTLIHCSWR